MDRGTGFKERHRRESAPGDHRGVHARYHVRDPEGLGDRFCDDHPRVSGKTRWPADRDAGVFYGGQEGGCSAGADGSLLQS